MVNMWTWVVLFRFYTILHSCFLCCFFFLRRFVAMHLLVFYCLIIIIKCTALYPIQCGSNEKMSCLNKESEEKRCSCHSRRHSNTKCICRYTAQSHRLLRVVQWAYTVIHIGDHEKYKKRYATVRQQRKINAIHDVQMHSGGAGIELKRQRYRRSVIKCIIYAQSTCSTIAA